MVFQSIALYPASQRAREHRFRAQDASKVRQETSSQQRGGRGRRRRSISTACSTARSTSSPVGSGSGWRSPRRWCAARALPARRAVFQPRRRAAPPDARRVGAHPPRSRNDDGLRHARSGRGDGHRRPDRGDERRASSSSSARRSISTRRRATCGSPASSARTRSTSSKAAWTGRPPRSICWRVVNGRSICRRGSASRRAPGDLCRRETRTPGDLG